MGPDPVPALHQGIELIIRSVLNHSKGWMLLFLMFQTSFKHVCGLKKAQNEFFRQIFGIAQGERKLAGKSRGLKWHACTGTLFASHDAFNLRPNEDTRKAKDVCFPMSSDRRQIVSWQEADCLMARGRQSQDKTQIDFNFCAKAIWQLGHSCVFLSDQRKTPERTKSVSSDVKWHDSDCPMTEVRLSHDRDQVVSRQKDAST